MAIATLQPLLAAALLALLAGPAAAGRPPGKPDPKPPAGAPKGRLTWTRLFDGKTLEGWTADGRGLWSVEDGCIVGEQDPRTHSEGWLLSESEWEDFVLIATFQITPGGNSGVFLRAPRARGHPGTRGFEVQIHDGDIRYPTGSVYDLAKAPRGLQQPEWNRLVICCIGSQMFTGVNGRVGAVAEAPQARSPRGRIGFQIHGGILYSEMAVRFKDVWAAPVTAPRDPPGGVRFRKVVLDLGPHEGAAVFDVDRDGRPDVACGPAWHRNSLWRAYPLREVSAEDPTTEWALPLDIDGDGRTDLVAGGGQYRVEHWFENPGRTGWRWRPHEYMERRGPIYDMLLLDLDGDGRVNDLLPSARGLIQWVRIDPGRSPSFTLRRIGSQGLGYGLGHGDLNGDGRVDVITPVGWYEQPGRATTQGWRLHREFKLRGRPGVPVVLDVNGDKAPDIVYGDGRGYGLWWLEQRAPLGGKRAWVEHVIDASFSQAYSIAVGDLNGDGQADLVTGKRWQAGDGADPGGHEPTCLYWFEHEGKGETWTRHVIDFNTGAGCGKGLRLADLDGDKDLDIVAPGRGGLYVFFNTGPAR